MSLGAWGDEGNVCSACQRNGGFCDEHPDGDPLSIAPTFVAPVCEECGERMVTKHENAPGDPGPLCPNCEPSDTAAYLDWLDTED